MNINNQNYEAFFLDYHEGNLSDAEKAKVLLFVEQNPELQESFFEFENIKLEDFGLELFEDKTDLKKHSLTPDILLNIEVRENYFIKSIEQQLTIEEQKTLDDFIVQFPQYISELELFRKTILPNEAELFFENKTFLKKYYTAEEELAIAYNEGLMSSLERTSFVESFTNNDHLANLVLQFAKTKLKIENELVFENKNKLKRKEASIIPFYIKATTIAAALALLFGLFYFYNSDNKKNKFTSVNNKTNDKPQVATINSGGANEIFNVKMKSTNALSNTNKKVVRAKKIQPNFEKENVLALTENNFVVDTNTFVANKNDGYSSTMAANTAVLENSVHSILSTEKNNNKANQSTTELTVENQTLSLKELATVKLKEKVLDEKAIKEQKKSGRLNKFTGIDFAQLAAKGLSKLVGRDIEVQAKYNQNGDVTQYGLAAGNLAFSRGR